MIGINAGRTLAILTVGLCAAAVDAAPWVVSGTATLRGGVEANPFLRAQGAGPAGVGGLTVAGNVTQEIARGKTMLIGSADIGQYSSKYGRNTNLLIGISRLQQLSEALQLNAQVTYTNTLNPQSNFGFDPSRDTATIDYLTIGTRSQRVDGTLNVDWRPTDKDTFRFGAFGNHSTYSNLATSTNDQLGGNFSYLRTIDARTSVGVQLVGSTIRSSAYPSAQSYQANLELVRQISAIWAFDGAIGLVKQHSNGFAATDRTTLGFNGSLCGTYPRSSICLTFSRQSVPSGIGGLRTDTRFGLNGTHNISERSRVTLTASFDDSSSRDIVAIPRQRYYDATLGYSRNISRRIAVGATSRYQRRETSGSTLLFGGTQTGYSLAATVSYAFGHSGT